MFAFGSDSRKNAGAVFRAKGLGSVAPCKTEMQDIQLCMLTDRIWKADVHEANSAA